MPRASRRRASLALAGTIAAICGLVLVAPVGVPTLVGGVVAVTFQRNDVTGSDLDSPEGGAPSVWLVVGEDRRDGDHPAVSTEEPRGSRADAVVLLSVGRGCAQMVSVPRDLMVHAPGHGDQRLGSLLDYGSPVLTRGVRTALGVPVHHYAQVDMGAVVEGVDAIGGVTLDLAHDARDVSTGLALSAGRVRLDGEDALALVRSRQYEEARAGGWVAVGADDRGRIARQQLLFGALRNQAPAAMTNGRAVSLVDAVTEHVSIDRRSGPADIAELVRAVTGMSLSLEVLPTTRVVPLGESLSPFPPAHVGTTGAVEPVEPATFEVLQRLTSCQGSG